MVKKWDLVRSERLNSLGIFSTRKDYSVSPVTGNEHGFYVLETPDWVNIIAVTPKDEIVLIRQFRHGTRSLTLEIPGGTVDPGEEPLEAAKRELLEETGYGAETWEQIGKIAPNPAFLDNSCYTFLASGARRVQEPAPDGTEDIEVELAPAGDITSYIIDGRIDHGIVVAAVFWYCSYTKRGR